MVFPGQSPVQFVLTPCKDDNGKGLRLRCQQPLDLVECKGASHLLAGTISVKSIFKLPLKTLGVALTELLRLWVLALSWIPLRRHGDLSSLLRVVVVLRLALLLHLLLLVLLVLLLLLEWCTNFLAETFDLLVDGHSELFRLANLGILESEIKESWACWLIQRIMPDGEILVLESLLGCDTFGRHERKHALQQVEGVWVGGRESLSVRDFRHIRKVGDVFSCAGGTDQLQRL